MKFRYKALDRRRQPDQLDSAMVLASPRGWVAVLVVLITAVFIGIWGLLGAIPRTLAVSGVLGHPGGIRDIQAPVPGTVMSLLEGDATMVRVGAEVGVLQSATGQSVPLLSPVAGRLVARTVRNGTIVAAGTPVLQVEAVEGPKEPLEVSLLVDADRAPYIHRDQEVTLAVPGVSPRTFGRLRGTVSAIGEYPLSAAGLALLTGAQAFQGGPGAGGIGPRLVTVHLLRDPASVSGYAWTSAGGPPIQLSSRTPVSAEIEVGSVSPFSLLVGG